MNLPTPCPDAPAASPADHPQPDTATARTGSRPVTIHCARCGSTHVERDAATRWDVESQQWVLGVLFDNAFCKDCEMDASLIERPVPTV